MDIKALLTPPVALPSMPRTVALLLNELGSEAPNLRRLNQLFGTDPALAARLLEQANQDAFQAPRQIVGIPEALALLDVRQLRALVAAAPLGTALRTVPGMNLPQFWRYSLNTAKLARSFAGLVHHNRIAAYTAGLLHGLGEIVLYLAWGEKALAMNALVAPLDVRRPKIEQRLCGFSYSQISAALAQQWRLPQEIVDALRYLHAPFDNEVYEPLAGVLHLAAWRARTREADMNDKELAVAFPGEIGLALGLDIDMVLQQDPIDWMARPDPGEYVV